MALILVTNDDPGVRALIRMILERSGHEVTEAENGEDGIRQFAQQRPDLLVIDLFMPAKEGIETIREVRGNWPDARIMAISGSGSAGLLDMAKALGADLTLGKPFRPAELLSAVESLLASA